MPMTEKLQQALMDPNTKPAQLAEMLKRDGINCRDSMSYDTPLIVAVRYNNIPAIEYILNNTKGPAEKNDVMNATNKQKESALNTAFKNNKEVALLLIKNGADLAKGLSGEIPSNVMEWMKPFIAYNELKDQKNLDKERLKKRAASEFEIGHRYYEFGDTAEAVHWFEAAAKDGDPEGMFNLALMYQKEIGDLTQAIHWYKQCYALWTDQGSREAIIMQLRQVSDLSSGNSEDTYTANMALGNIYAVQGDITNAFNYFKKAEEIFSAMPNKNHNDELFFKACSFWT